MKNDGKFKHAECETKERMSLKHKILNAYALSIAFILVKIVESLDLLFLESYRKHQIRYDLIKLLSNRQWNGIEMHVPTALVAHRTFARFGIEKDLRQFINDHVKDGVFWDVGACVGNFSILAARNNCTVVSFEPDGLTYSTLVNNTGKCEREILTLPIALGEVNRTQTLYMQKFEAANAYNTVGREVQYDGKSFNAKARQTVIEFRGDFIISELMVPAPEFIKIDVDGNELMVLRGLGDYLNNPRLKGIAIELVGDGAEVKIARELILAKNFRKLDYAKGNLAREANEFFIR